MIKELVIQRFLGLYGSSDVVHIELNPYSALDAPLLNVDLLHFSEIGTNQLNLVLHVDVEARLLFQVHFLGIKHVLKQNTV